MFNFEVQSFLLCFGVRTLVQCLSHSVSLSRFDGLCVSQHNYVNLYSNSHMTIKYEFHFAVNWIWLPVCVNAGGAIEKLQGLWRITVRWLLLTVIPQVLKLFNRTLAWRQTLVIGKSITFKLRLQTAPFLKVLALESQLQICSLCIKMGSAAMNSARRL